MITVKRTLCWFWCKKNSKSGHLLSLVLEPQWFYHFNWSCWLKPSTYQPWKVGQTRYQTWNVNFYYYCLDQLIQENFPCVNIVYQLYVWGCFSYRCKTPCQTGLSKKKKKNMGREWLGCVVLWRFEEQILGVARFVGSWQSEFHSSLSLLHCCSIERVLSRRKILAAKLYNILKAVTLTETEVTLLDNSIPEMLISLLWVLCDPLRNCCGWM